MPLRAIASVNCFCAKKYTRITGSTARTAPAIRSSFSGPASEMKVDSPTVMGRQRAVRVATKGHCSEFYDPTNARNATVNNGAPDRGSTIDARARV